MIDNVGDGVVLPEKVVISQKVVITFLAITGNATRDQNECIHGAVVPRNLFSFFHCANRQKVWKTLVLKLG